MICFRSKPTERCVCHTAGLSGLGASRYTDSVVLRDRDQGVAWSAAGIGALDERRYYCQNWRGDVVALTKSTGVPLEYVRYSSYGEPTVYPVADLNMDGKVDSADAGEWYDVAYGAAGTGAYSPDIDFDDAFDGSGGTDENLFYESYDANNGKSGIGKVSTDAVANRVGYAAYQWDPTIASFHVRYRVYKPEIGRWTARDPEGYVDGVSLYEYVASSPTNQVDSDGRGITSLDSALEACMRLPTVSQRIQCLEGLAEALGGNPVDQARIRGMIQAMKAAANDLWEKSVKWTGQCGVKYGVYKTACAACLGCSPGLDCDVAALNAGCWAACNAARNAYDSSGCPSPPGHKTAQAQAVAAMFKCQGVLVEPRCLTYFGKTISECIKSFKP